MSPNEVLADAWAAFAQGDGYALAARATDESLLMYREMTLSGIEYDSKEQSLEDYMAEMAHLPREVAEYYWRELQTYKASSRAGILRRYRSESIDDIRSLDTPELLTRAIRAVHEKIRLATLLPGHVLESPDRAFVLLRVDCITEVTGLDEPPRVASLRRIDSAWRVELIPHPLGMPGYESFSAEPQPIGEDQGA